MTTSRARYAVSERANRAILALNHASAYLEVWRTLRAEGKTAAEVGDKLTLARGRIFDALVEADTLIAEAEERIEALEAEGEAKP